MILKSRRSSLNEMVHAIEIVNNARGGIEGKI